MSVEGPERFTGGCRCGSVRIGASGRPYRVGVCHCLDCRKLHGALFHASAIFPQDAVTMYPFDATRTPSSASEVRIKAVVDGTRRYPNSPSSPPRDRRSDLDPRKGTEDESPIQ